ncbi:hypothetical protein Ga0466249_001268 [Sporomusaceae bacterium BoRhaA]|nr:hypothetical protein [Pelorhabdus rhamnosifermentans]
MDIQLFQTFLTVLLFERVDGSVFFRSGDICSAC